MLPLKPASGCWRAGRYLTRGSEAALYIRTTHYSPNTPVMAPQRLFFFVYRRQFFAETRKRPLLPVLKPVSSYPLPPPPHPPPPSAGFETGILFSLPYFRTSSPLSKHDFQVLNRYVPKKLFCHISKSTTPHYPLELDFGEQIAPLEVGVSSKFTLLVVQTFANIPPPPLFCEQSIPQYPWNEGRRLFLYYP